jgi:hypothetical protein
MIKSLTKSFNFAKIGQKGRCKMKGVSLLIGLVFFLSSSLAYGLVLAGFNGSDTYGYGTWKGYPKDTTQTIVGLIDNSQKVGKRGGSYRIVYDVESPKPAYVGFWMGLGGLDLSKYQKVVLWIKGSKKDGFTSKVMVGIESVKEGGGGTTFIDGITDEWKKFEIPISAFNLKDLHVNEFDIVIDKGYATSKTGTIYLDEISLR